MAERKRDGLKFSEALFELEK